MRAASCLIAIAAFTGFLQAQPINDHFTNRVVLAGSSITFTADLNRASVEAGEPWNQCFSAVRSVWYEWRAAETAPVLLQLLRATSTTNGYQFLAVIVHTSTSPPESGFTGVTPIACALLTTAVEGAYLGFQAEAGVYYYIKAGTEWQPRMLEFRLEVSPIPVILEHPRDVSVDPGSTALFKASAISGTSLRYQWLKDSGPLSGETSTMLMVTNLTTADTGDYSVIVSNQTGSVTSRVAHLRVTRPIVRPVLSLAPGPGPDASSVRFAGELGRSYRIESSQDLTSWAPEPILNRIPAGSVVIQTNSEVMLPVSSLGGPKFFRVATYHPANSLCEANLRRIRHAKELWARDTGRQASETPALMDLLPYYKNSREPRCPTGGFYAINALGLQPTCSLPVHRLEEPR